MNLITKLRAYWLNKKIKALYERHAQLSWELAEIGNQIRVLEEKKLNAQPRKTMDQ